MADIGRLALKVTTNAAPALKGLNDFDKQVGSTMKSVEKTVEKSGEGGGVFKSFLAGGVVGAGLAFATQNFGKILGMIGNVQTEAAKLGFVFNNADAKGISRATESVGRLQGVMNQTFGKAIAAAEPALTKIAALFSDLLTRAQPTINWIVERVGTGLVYAFYATAGAIEVVTGRIGEMGNAFKETDDAAERWIDWGKTAKMVLKSVGIAFGYLFDTVALGWGLLLTPFGKLLKIAGEMGEKAGVGWAKDLTNFGATMEEAAWAAVTSWGASHDEINSMFDDIETRVERSLNTFRNLPTKAAQYMAAPALIAGTQPEYSVRVKSQMETTLKEGENVAKQQLAAQKAAAEILKRVQEELREIKQNLKFEVF